MRILAFDTATPATTVALEDHGVVHEARDDPPAGQRPRHASRLLDLISGLLERAQLDWDEIDRLGVGTGPGTFTGLRIGIATAQALGRAAGVPLVAVPTLESLALNAHQQEYEVVAGVIDARRGEVYAGAWDTGKRDQGPALPVQAMSPEALAAALDELGSAPLAIGDGAVAFRPVLERSGVFVPEDGSELHRVTAVNHLSLARRLPVTDPDTLRPDYQRLPDAIPRADPASPGPRMR